MEATQAIKVLIVDDERAIRRFLRVSLTSRGWLVHEAATGAEALAAVAAGHPDAVLLDLGLPDMDGKEVIRRIREWTDVPIIIVSVRDNELEKIAALDAGADDFVAKPFSVGELMARLRATIRRTVVPDADPVYTAGELMMDLAKRLVTLSGKEVQLTPNEYELLRAFMQNAGKVLTHRMLLRQIWGPAYEKESHLLQVHISNLRRKIESDPTQPRHITTEPGVGYRFKE